MKNIISSLVVCLIIFFPRSNVMAQSGDRITMAMPTGAVEIPLQDAIHTILEASPPQTFKQSYYAVSNVTFQGEHYLVAVTGLNAIQPDYTWNWQENAVEFWQFDLLKQLDGSYVMATSHSGFSFTPGPVGEGGAGDNLATPALGATATASTTLGIQVASNVLDSNDYTGWASTAEGIPGPWILVDLGQAREIGSFRVLLDSATTSYRVDYGDDGVNWTTAVTRTVTGSNDDVVSLSSNINARYWKFVVTGVFENPETSNWYIATIELREGPPPDVPQSYYSTAETTNIFPWFPGTEMAYGSRGVHPAAIGYPGWVAVDFWSNGSSGMAPNMVYAVASGTLQVLCHDDHQYFVRIGDFMYDHITSLNFQDGDRVNQRDAIGPMLVGDVNDTCGWASNGGGYHVHVGFPSYYNTIQFENCLLSIITQNWDCQGTNVSVGGHLTANWSGSPIIPPNGGGPGANGLWGLLLNGIQSLVNFILPIFPSHTSLNLATTVTDYADAYLELIYMIFLTTFNMTLPVLMVISIISLEMVRAAYSLYKKIKTAIPVAG